MFSWRFIGLSLEQTYGYLLNQIQWKDPAVITVFYEPETAIGWEEKLIEICLPINHQKRFVTLSLGTKQTTKDKTLLPLYYPTINNSTMQPLSVLVCVAANAWEVLARVESVDSPPGLDMGHSHGAKWLRFCFFVYMKVCLAPPGGSVSSLMKPKIIISIIGTLVLGVLSQS